MGIVDDLMVRPCTITRNARTGSEDAYGMPLVVGTSQAATVCYVEQEDASEVTGGREAEVQTFRGYFPAGTEFDGTDVVTVGTSTFEVIGPPWDAHDPFSDTFDHVEVSMREVTG